MIRIYLWNGVIKNSNRYKTVKRIAKEKNEVTLKAIKHQGNIFNLYGCHRLTSAKELNIIPTLILLPYSEKFANFSLGDYANAIGDDDIYLHDNNCYFPICKPMKWVTTVQNDRLYIDFKYVNFLYKDDK